MPATKSNSDGSVLSNMRTLYTGLLSARDSQLEQSANPEESQPIHIFGAGFGRTGTSSLVVALRQLGLNPYHMREGVIEGGHQPLWLDYARAMQASDANATAVAAAAILHAMAVDGFNATTDFPACLLTTELLAAYPNARVVLSVRQSGSAWATSVLDSIARFPVVMQMPPWSWVHTLREFRALNEWIFEFIGARVDPGTGMPRHAELAAAHDLRVHDIQRLVPPGQLLIHQSKDGWAPLCSFLASADGPAVPALVVSRCERLVSDGTPYPHVNDTPSMQRFLLLMRATSMMTVVGLPILAIFLVYRCFGHRARAPRGKAE